MHYEREIPSENFYRNLQIARDPGGLLRLAQNASNIGEKLVRIYENDQRFHINTELR